MRAVVVESALKPPGENFNVQPFRLNAESSIKPTEFEITVIIDHIRYQYSFELTPQRITKEYLLVYKASKPQQWFSRQYNPTTDADHYEFGPHFKGQKSLLEKATRPNALFLSMAVQLNNEQLRPLFDEFMNKLIIFNEITPLNPLISMLVRRLVELFHSPSLNTKGAQLIFTTHDTSLLDPDILRRDQIWFVEKNKEQVSILYPLSDFSPRKNEAFEKGYLIGRYGATPFFDEWDGVEE